MFWTRPNEMRSNKMPNEMRSSFDNCIRADPRNTDGALIRRSYQPHGHAFSGRNQAALGVMPKRDERIAFRIVGRETSGRNVVGTHDETVDLTSDAVVNRCRKAHNLSLLEGKPSDILLVHEQHHAGAGHAPEAVAIGI